MGRLSRFLLWLTTSPVGRYTEAALRLRGWDLDPCEIRMAGPMYLRLWLQEAALTQLACILVPNPAFGEAPEAFVDALVRQQILALGRNVPPSLQLPPLRQAQLFQAALRSLTDRLSSLT